MKLDVASPCSESWDTMDGDDRARFCGRCRLNVYNLDVMTENELETLIQEKEGNVCVRMMQRKDGTVITRDCPVGMGRKRRRRAFFGAIAAGIVAFVGWVGFKVQGNQQCNSPYAGSGHLADNEPFSTISRIAPWLVAPAPTPVPGQRLVGKIAYPLPMPPPTTTTNP